MGPDSLQHTRQGLETRAPTIEKLDRDRMHRSMSNAEKSHTQVQPMMEKADSPSGETVHTTSAPVHAAAFRSARQRRRRSHRSVKIHVSSSVERMGEENAHGTAESAPLAARN